LDFFQVETFLGRTGQNSVIKRKRFGTVTLSEKSQPYRREIDWISPTIALSFESLRLTPKGGSFLLRSIYFELFQANTDIEFGSFVGCLFFESS